MRTHTIPQNVTSYEDKIVGMLIGRQFVYIAIGGVVAFVLLTADMGLVPIRMLLAVIVLAWSAAMALLKINDRGFDALFFSFVKAVVGPTEWVWQQDRIPMKILLQPDIDQAATQAAAAAQPDPLADAVQNRIRVSQFERFLAGNSTELDDDELEFIQKLNYAEPVPDAAFPAKPTEQDWPPMLTPDHPRPTPAVPQPAKTFTPPPPAHKPLVAIATPSSPQVKLPLAGQSTSIPLRSNMRVNRSLSKQLLSGGTLPLPVRGELHLSLPPELRNELTGLIGYAPAGLTYAMASAGSTAGSASLPVKPAGQPAPQQPISHPTDVGQARTKISDQPVVAQASASDQTAQPTPPTSPSSPKPAVSRPQPEPAAFQPPAQPPRPEQPPAPAPQPLPEPEPAQQPLSTAAADSTSDITLPSAQSLDADGLDQVAADVTAQLEAASQADLPPEQAPSSADGQAQQNIKASNAIPFKLHDSGQPADPVKQVRPILNTIFDEPVAPLPNSALGSPATPAVTVVEATPAPTAKVVPLTSHPNVVNGIVLDSQDQFVPGVVVVVKDSAGEPKRALKTNKLGQFVIQTPLPNGTYTVEVDRKGLSFDIMKVELTGTVLPPIQITAKTN